MYKELKVNSLRSGIETGGNKRGGGVEKVPR